MRVERVLSQNTLRGGAGKANQDKVKQIQRAKQQKQHELRMNEWINSFFCYCRRYMYCRLAAGNRLDAGRYWSWLVLALVLVAVLLHTTRSLAHTLPHFSALVLVFSSVSRALSLCFCRSGAWHPSPVARSSRGGLSFFFHSTSSPSPHSTFTPGKPRACYQCIGCLPSRVVSLYLPNLFYFLPAKLASMASAKCWSLFLG